MYAVVVQANGSTQPFGCVLDLFVFMGNSMIKTCPHVFNTNHCSIGFSQCHDMDAFIFFAVDGAIDEVPQDISQHILIRIKGQAIGYAVEDNIVASHGQGLQAHEQLIDELMQGNLCVVCGSHGCYLGRGQREFSGGGAFGGGGERTFGGGGESKKSSVHKMSFTGLLLIA